MPAESETIKIRSESVMETCSWVDEFPCITNVNMRISPSGRYLFLLKLGSQLTVVDTHRGGTKMQKLFRHLFQFSYFRVFEWPQSFDYECLVDCLFQDDRNAYVSF
jgi:hypothetical protein